ncbi:MAG TPA: hypothetical protein VN039_03315 [Nitrospira sp.]|nr:hypothetical protein [Nitrospira sp.]
MSQSKPVPHTLSAVYKTDKGARMNHGPVQYPTRAEAERQKRILRADILKSGGQFLASVIERA